MDTKIIMLGNIKGGVGKTSSVAALGDILARKFNKKILLIDADPQGSLSRLFGYGAREKNVKTTLDLFLMSEYEARKTNRENPFKPTAFFNKAVLSKPRSKMNSKYENLHLMCSTNQLLNVYQTLYIDPTDAISLISRFLFWLKGAKLYDYVLIDTFPNLSTALSQFMLGSDYLMVPLPPSEDAMDGAERILTLFNAITDSKKNYIYKNIDFLGFFFCEIAEKGIADRDYRLNKSKFWDENTFFSSFVPRSTAVLNASNKKAPVTVAFPNSPAAKGYVKIASEMLDRIAEMEAHNNGENIQ